MGEYSYNRDKHLNIRIACSVILIYIHKYVDDYNYIAGNVNKLLFACGKICENLVVMNNSHREQIYTVYIVVMTTQV